MSRNVITTGPVAVIDVWDGSTAQSARYNPRMRMLQFHNELNVYGDPDYTVKDFTLPKTEMEELVETLFEKAGNIPIAIAVAMLNLPYEKDPIIALLEGVIPREAITEHDQALVADDTQQIPRVSLRPPMFPPRPRP